MTSTGLLQPTADLGINAAAFSPDGKLAAISQREKLTLLEVESRKARWSLPVQQGKITALVFSPDGNRLISFISSYSKVSPLGKSLLRTILVQTLDIRTGRIEKEITQVEADAVEHAAFSSDGTLFGVATRGNSAIFLWNVTSGRMTPVLLKEEFGEISAAFSLAGDLMAISIGRSGMDQNKVDMRLYNTKTGKLICNVAGGWALMTFHALAFSPDGRILAFSTDSWRAANRGEIRFFDVNTGKVFRTVKELDIAVDAIGFTGNGESVVAMGLDYSFTQRLTSPEALPVDRQSKVFVWDVKTGELRTGIQTTTPANEGARARITESMVVPSHDVLAAITNGSLHFYDMETALFMGGIHVRDPQSGNLVFSEKPQLEKPLRRKAVGISVDRIAAIYVQPGGRLYAGSNDGMIYRWDIRTGRPLGGSKTDTPIKIMAWSADGRAIAINGPGEGEVAVLDAATGAVRYTLPGGSGLPSALAFSPDGEWLSAGSDNGSITIWNLKTRAMLPRLNGHAGAVNTLSFAADSGTLASGGSDLTVRLWKPGSREALQTLRGHLKSVTAAAFAPTGNILATAAADSDIIVWDTGQNRALRKLSGHEGPVGFLCFAPNGSTLVSAGEGSFMLWNAKTGKLVNVLTETGTPGTSSNGRGPRTVINLHKDPLIRYFDTILTAAFSSDGRILACGGGNNGLLVWDTDTWEYRILRSSEWSW